MARHTSKTLVTPQKPGLCFAKPRSLWGDTPFCYRYRLTDPCLQASIKKSGILIPLIVIGAEHPVVIAGHKRLHAARVLKMREVPVITARKMRPEDAFLLNLVSNWKQEIPETDRARALGMASRRFHFKKSDLLEVLMPLLGLSGDMKLLELYLWLDGSPVSLKDLVADGKWTLRGVTFLAKFREKDQDYFAREIGARVHLTSSQLLQAGEWLADILKSSGKTLQKLCEEHRILEGLDARGMDSRTKADRFFGFIKRLRYPGYSSYLEEFEERRSNILRDADEFRLEPVQGFEEPGFELRARVKTPEALDRLLGKLSGKRAALNSLFEIAL